MAEAILQLAVVLLTASATFGVESGNTDGVPESELREAKLVASDGRSGDQLGWSAAIDGDLLVIGAVNSADSGEAYVFARDTEGWVEKAVLRPTGEAPNASFGNSVDVADEMIVVGAPGDRVDGAEVGAVYVFRQIEGRWQMQSRVLADDGAAGDRFGESVSLSSDRLAVGAPNRDERASDGGAVYVFSATDGVWTEEARLIGEGIGTADLFGAAVAVDGLILVAGAPTDTGVISAPGFAYVFERNAKGWVEIARLSGPGSQRDLFGLSVDVVAGTVIVGAPRVAPDLPSRPGGAVYVFERTGARWRGQRLEASGSMSGDRFGFSVSTHGGTIVASAVGLCSVSVFRRSGSRWSEETTLHATDGCQAGFGRAVAAGVDTIVAGTPSDGEQGNGAGAVYVYEELDEEVILGPGIQFVVAGEQREIDLTLDSRGVDVASFRFEALVPAELTFEADAQGSVDCRLSEDVAADFVLDAFLVSDPLRLQVALIPIADPPHPLSRDGLIARCPVHVDQEVEPGTRPFLCASSSARASGVGGEALATRCRNGRLTILAPCSGDCDASGRVSIDELLLGIGVALGLQPSDACSAFDPNRDGEVAIDELVKAVSAALNGCSEL